MKNLGSIVPLYIYIKIFKLKKKKDEAAPYVVIQNDLKDNVKWKKQFTKCSNYCVEYAHMCIWEEQEEWIYMYISIYTHAHLFAYICTECLKGSKKKTGCLWREEWGGWLKRWAKVFCLPFEFYYVHVLSFQELKFRFIKKKKEQGTIRAFDTRK